MTGRRVAALGAALLGGTALGLALEQRVLPARPSAEPARADAAPPIGDVRVLVLNVDPAGARPGRSLREALGWNDPRRLAAEYIADVRRASGGSVAYRVVAWRDVREFPAKADGFRYTQESFLACWRDRQHCHDPDGADYPRLLAEHGVVPPIDSGVVDEVWLFGGPYFGFWEAAMAGPGAFDINGGVYQDVASRRPFAIMGFNYERGVAEMLHDLCHRVEATMSRVYGGWQAERLTTPWARFAASAAQSGGAAGAGSCHYPPNAAREYEYDNPRAVPSDADDWLRYPRLIGARRPVSRESWGGPDYHRRFMVWWLTRLPRAAGADTAGRLNDWWRYVFHAESARAGTARAGA